MRVASLIEANDLLFGATTYLGGLGYLEALLERIDRRQRPGRRGVGVVIVDLRLVRTDDIRGRRGADIGGRARLQGLLKRDRARAGVFREHLGDRAIDRGRRTDQITHRVSVARGRDRALDVVGAAVLAGLVDALVVRAGARGEARRGAGAVRPDGLDRQVAERLRCGLHRAGAARRVEDDEVLVVADHAGREQREGREPRRRVGGARVGITREIDLENTVDPHLDDAGRILGVD